MTVVAMKADDPVTALAQALSEASSLKLWSVIVSCLGDCAQAGQAEVSGLVLSALVERIGLQPQAMRVALHRLKRDGWVDSRREGRVGFHRLTESGQAQSRAVAGRIYGPPVQGAPCRLVGFPPDAPDALALLPGVLSAVPLSRSFALVCGPDQEVPEDWLVALPEARGWPVWVRAVLDEAACEVEFTALSAALPPPGTLPRDPLDRFALRVLVLHGWRRLVLRSNPAAEAALGADRAEARCRAQVADLLDAIGPARPDQVLS
jgi:phenylacetic acid degradation operon negative regulatory protein